MEKTILLTGASGFLGSFILKKIIEQKYKVVILKRSFSNLFRIKNMMDKVIYYDVDTTGCRIAFEENRIDIIIHTATNYGRNGENSVAIVESNFMLPLKLLECATLFKTEVFFNTDTILSKYMNAYSLSKRHFLEWMRWYSNNLQIKIINMKLEHFYGPSDNKKKFITKIIYDLINNADKIDLTVGLQKRDFIYIDDVVNSFLTILNNLRNINEKYNDFEVGSGNSIEIREIVQLMKKLSGNIVTNLNFGAIPLRRNEVMDSKADIRKLQKLDWHPKVSLEDGLLRTIRFEQSVSK